METQVHIRKRWLTCMEILVLFFFLTQTTSALSTNPDQEANWETCTFESRDFDLSLCNPGTVRNTHTLGCSPKKLCCVCPISAWMDKYNNCSVCKPFRDCEAEGKQVLVRGNITHDTVCGDDILATSVASWSVGPVMTTMRPAVESTSAIQPNQMKIQPDVTATSSLPGADEEGRGTSVIKFGGGTAFFILVCTLLIFFIIFLVVLFICNPQIPQTLHDLFCKKKPETNINVIHMKDLEVGGEDV